jgi:hypothetical protein
VGKWESLNVLPLLSDIFNLPHQNTPNYVKIKETWFHLNLGFFPLKEFNIKCFYQHNYRQI